MEEGMGLFDSVMVPCPKCDKPVEFQSKAGECCCAVYSLADAPAEILADIMNCPEYCEKCGQWFALIDPRYPPGEKPKPDLRSVKVRTPDDPMTPFQGMKWWPEDQPFTYADIDAAERPPAGPAREQGMDEGDERIAACRLNGQPVVRVSAEGAVSLPEGLTWLEALNLAKQMKGPNRGFAIAALNLYAHEHLSRDQAAATRAPPMTPAPPTTSEMVAGLLESAEQCDAKARYSRHVGASREAKEAEAEAAMLRAIAARLRSEEGR